jgi:glycolate oxidase FAD binding subunit
MSERSVVLPASTDETAAVVRDAAERDLTIVPRGAGLGWVTVPGDLIVDMSQQDQVIEHAAGDLVARVQAGATMGHVAQVLAAAGQRLALDVPPEITVGGMIATSTAGPLRFRYGSPRDLLIGITVVRPDGVVAHSGGKVVKNVAGYDLGKLFAGSRGTLGLITEATFRLHPLPQAVAYLTTAPGADGTPAGSAVAVTVPAAVIGAANSPLQASAVELGPDLTVGVLLEGTTAGVAERARRMAEILPAVSISQTPPPWWGRLPQAYGTVIGVTFWLARLGGVLGAIADSGVPARVCGPAGAGLLYVCPEAGADTDGLVAALRAVVADRGSVAVLTEPPGPADALTRSALTQSALTRSALTGAIRDQFDPAHRMGGLCRTTKSSVQ